MDLKILNTTDGVLSGSIRKEQRLVSGVQSLIQQVVIELVSDFSPVLNRGAGLQSTIETADPSNPSLTKSDIISAITLAKAHLMSNQESVRFLDKTEILIDLKPKSVTSYDGVQWTIDLELITAAGTTTTTLVL